LVVLVGIIGFLLGKSFSQPKTSPPPISQVSPSPTPENPTPTPDPTANWKTYTNEKYGYTFKYPSSFDLKTAKDLEYGGSGWETVYFVPNNIPSPTTKDVKIVLENIDKVSEAYPGGVKEYFNTLYAQTPEPESMLSNKG